MTAMSDEQFIQLKEFVAASIFDSDWFWRPSEEECHEVGQAVAEYVKGMFHTPTANEIYADKFSHEFPEVVTSWVMMNDGRGHWEWYDQTSWGDQCYREPGAGDHEHDKYTTLNYREHPAAMEHVEEVLYFDDPDHTLPMDLVNLDDMEDE